MADVSDAHGAVGPVDVNMNGVIARSQAHTVDMAGKSFTAQMSRQSLMADKLFAEVDLAQALAGRYATTGTPSEKTAAGG